jgi:hypothetical protein
MPLIDIALRRWSLGSLFALTADCSIGALIAVGSVFLERASGLRYFTIV